VHQEEIDQLKSTHAKDITRLKDEQLEISAYNENIEEQVRKLQQDNDLLKKTM
jgi:hypothetical protein